MEKLRNNKNNLLKVPIEIVLLVKNDPKSRELELHFQCIIQIRKIYELHTYLIKPVSFCLPMRNVSTPSVI